MALLLRKMNLVSESLVATGILPAIPGLFGAPGALPPSSPATSSPTSTSSPLASTHKTTPSLPNDSVSEALRTLIRDMERFKTYLMQVDDCRSKLAQLESAQEATERCLLAAKSTVSIRMICLTVVVVATRRDCFLF